MTLPFRRRGRPRGAARLALAGDFHAADRDIAEAIQAVPPAPWDGTTVPLSALRDQPRYAPAAWHPAPVHEEQPIMLAGQRAPWVMTVDPPRPGGPGPTPQAVEVARFLRDRVAILRRRGQLDRISQDKLAMLPSDRIRNRRTTARLIVDEAAELLRCGGDPR